MFAFSCQGNSWTSRVFGKCWRVMVQGHGPTLVELLDATVESHGLEEMSQAIPESIPLFLLVVFLCAQSPERPRCWRLS